MTELNSKLIGAVTIICLGSLQFGYHMAELNSPGAILSCHASVPASIAYSASFFGRHGFKQCIELSSEQIGLATSIFSFGGLIGSFYIGSVADAIGRRKSALIHNVFFFVGSFLNGLANSYTTLLLGRFVAGIGAGSALVVTSLVINEISPPKSKGFLGSMNQVSINVGILFTQVLALWFCNDNDWRLLLFTASAIAFINFVLIYCYMVESPMWLFNKGMASQAFGVLHSLRGGEFSAAKNEVNSWRHGPISDTTNASVEALLQDEGVATTSTNVTVTLKEYLQSSEYRNSKLVGTGILVFQQFCGINSIIFYGVSVLINIFPEAAVMINCMISVVNTVVTFCAAPLVDKLGRKPLLMSSVSVMGLSSLVLGYGISTSNATLSIMGTFIYIAFFAVGLGPIPFLLVGEVTQPKAKASAQSWGVTMNWVATFVVGYFFPIIKNSWVGAGVYYIFATMCGLSLVFIRTFVPETKGCDSYEEVWSATMH